MGRTRSTIIGAGVAVLLTAAALAAQGVPSDRTTYVTVSGPVSLPGVTLPAGEYLFRLADLQSSRNVVQIFNRDRSKIFATLIAIPAERNEVSDEAVITFKETPSDRPPAIRYWYYAGEKSGQEFAYPKEQAQLIANASHESVLSVDAPASDVEAMKSAEITRVEPSASAAANESASAQTARPESQPAAQPEAQSATPQSQPAAQPEPQAAAPQPQSQPETSTAATPERMPESAPAVPSAAQSTTRPERSSEMPTGTSGRTSSRELPRTASGLPLVALIGFAALAAAMAAHRARRQLATSTTARRR